MNSCLTSSWVVLKDPSGVMHDVAIALELEDALVPKEPECHPPSAPDELLKWKGDFEWTKTVLLKRDDAVENIDVGRNGNMSLVEVADGDAPVVALTTWQDAGKTPWQTGGAG